MDVFIEKDTLEEQKIKNTNIKNILNFVHLCESLKIQLRYGIKSDGNRESIAEHSWRLALLVVLCSPYVDFKIDTEKALKMAIIHDLVEIYAGDVHFLDLENPDVKKKRNEKEFQAIHKIRNLLNNEVGEELFHLWIEFDSNSTNEAKFVLALDKLEGYIQQNEADIETWTQEEAQSIFTYLDPFCDFDNFLRALKDVVVAEAILKMKKTEKFNIVLK
ncbi:MAG: HD domain-containing protein [Simkaniaceae bacterium]